MHRLPEVAGAENKYTNSINHWSFNGMQPCEKGEKQLQGNKKAKNKSPSCLWPSGYHIFACNIVTSSWRSMERVQRESMLENVKTRGEWIFHFPHMEGKKESTPFSSWQREKFCHQHHLLCFEWVTELSDLHWCLNLVCLLQTVNFTILVKLWNYAFKSVFCWYILLLVSLYLGFFLISILKGRLHWHFSVKILSGIGLLHGNILSIWRLDTAWTFLLPI